jgi:anthranilate synthase/aminodeoxychorismate synthase-like glutamine amidotransferase
MIDNFDSFTFNLVQYLRELGSEVLVVRNDTDLALHDVLEDVDGLVVSPGPCTPVQAGRSIEALQLAASMDGPRRPALGVCLGHQALAEAFGGQVVRASTPMHGKTSNIWHDGTPPFTGIPSPTEVMRYHSLIVSSEDLPAVLRVTARTTDGTIMGLAHRELPMYGVQFHPESIMTGEGKRILTSFLRVVEAHARHELPAVSVVA